MIIINKTKTIALLFLFISCSTNTKNSVEGLNLSGNVKSLKETVFEAKEKFGKLEKGKVSFECIEILLRNCSSVSQYIFNKNKNLIELNDYSSRNNELQYKQSLEYDKNQKIVNDKHYTYDGSLNKLTNYIYNESSKLIKALVTSPEGDTINIYEYDNKERIVKVIGFKQEYSDAFVYKYNYDEKDRIIEFVAEKSDGKITVDKYIYVEDLLREVQVIENGNIISKRTYEYNEIKNKINIKYFIEGNLNEELNIKYLYDNNNNWYTAYIKVEKNSNIENFIIEREIEYY